MTEIDHADVRCEPEGLAESETNLRNEEMDQAIRAALIALMVNLCSRFDGGEVSKMLENSERGQIHHDVVSDHECLAGAAS